MSVSSLQLLCCTDQTNSSASQVKGWYESPISRKEAKKREFLCMDVHDLVLNGRHQVSSILVQQTFAIVHFTVVCLVTWPGGDLVLIQASMLLLCKPCCANAN